MATAESCPLTPSHPPKARSQTSFKHLLPTIKHSLIHLRHNHNKHEPQYFSAVSQLTDAELISFNENDLVEVRVGKVAYGIIVFGKVRLPKSEGGFVFVRWFVGGEDGDVEEGEVKYKFHSFYTEEGDEGTGGYRAIIGEGDELKLFDE
ncbi:hypothetical protein EJ08DRAFT_629759 [Tothia fuscella]|uniref:Uncharacterized protein n=1 Tax=Tothia fuscella TaxID=1048955 RepID=A0A9P4NWD5_9PEZI|nr:hypothetical protein EJ08DRAFT_629759 [Tothia fuscella]